MVVTEEDMRAGVYGPPSPGSEEITEILPIPDLGDPDEEEDEDYDEDDDVREDAPTQQLCS